MILFHRFRNLPVTVRVPLVAAALMIVFGVLASQSVLAALTRTHDARLSETARLHVQGLSVALGPSVVRQDVWEVYDILDRARSAFDGQRLLLTVVADERGQVLAATDPRLAPVGKAMDDFEKGAVDPALLRMTGEPILKVKAPLGYQGREIGRIVTELDVTDLLSEQRSAAFWLLLGNALATLVLAFGGWLAVARILRPVGVIIRAMDDSKGVPGAIAEADIPKGDPGLARLISTYNRMTAAVRERAESERRLAERERFVSLGRLSSSLAHEINNPLGGLLNAADTIKVYADRPQVVRQSAELLQRGLNHLREVTRAILDEYRIDRAGSRLRPEDFEDLRLLFEPEVHSREQELEWRVDADPAAMAALPAAPVRQFTLNLLLNAAAAAGPAGKVGLEVADGERGLTIAVRDNGPGLAPGNLERLTRDDAPANGGGVGLRMVRQLVMRANGSIAVARQDATTVITVRLPHGDGEARS